MSKAPASTPYVPGAGGRTHDHCELSEASLNSSESAESEPKGQRVRGGETVIARWPASA